LAGRLTSLRIFLPALAIAGLVFAIGAYFNLGWLPIEFGALFALSAFFPALLGALFGASLRQKRIS
jgi:hypothetical protein